MTWILEKQRFDVCSNVFQRFRPYNRTKWIDLHDADPVSSYKHVTHSVNVPLCTSISNWSLRFFCFFPSSFSVGLLQRLFRCLPFSLERSFFKNGIVTHRVMRDESKGGYEKRFIEETTTGSRCLIRQSIRFTLAILRITNDRKLVVIGKSR